MARVRVVRKVKRTGAAEQAANAKYNPQIQQVNREIQTSRQYQRQIPEFYNQYRQDLQAIQQANDARAAQQAQSSEANRAAISTQENADYMRVHGINQPVGADKESQAAAQSRQVAAGVVSGILSAQSANTRNSEIGKINEEQARRSTLRQQRSAIKGEKKQYQREVRTKIRSDAQAARIKQAQFALQQWKAQVAAQQGQARINQGNQRLQLSAEQNASNRRSARQRIRLSRRGQDISNANAQRRLNKTTTAKAPTSTDLFNNDVNRAIGIVNSFGPTGREKWIRNPQGLIVNLTRRGISGQAAAQAIKLLRASHN